MINAKVNVVFYFLSLFFTFFSRRIFLDNLGAEFIGLTGTLGNILGYLNLAEFGVGTSITYFLYKPLQQEDHAKTNEIMSVLAFLYRIIGYVLIVAGLVVSLFFPLIFTGEDVRLLLIYFTFYSFLAQSIVGYFINYRQLILTANQQQYIVSAYLQSISIVQNIVQILLAWYFQNLYLWVTVGLIFSVIGSVVLNYRINTKFAWLDTNIRHGKLKLKAYPDILHKTGQVFMHKIKNFILYNSDELFVFAFVSMKMVAFYGNYMMILNKLNVLVNMLSAGMNAGVGNLVAENNEKNTMKVFWELTAIRFLLAGVIIFVFLLFLQPFVMCWLGREYLLDDIIVYLLLFNFFIFLSRGVVEMYISACGLFQDVWTAWLEFALNIGITLSLAPHYGIVGILLGKILSVAFIAMFWKPYFLFTKGLHRNVSEYWHGMAKYYGIFIVFLIIAIALKIFVTDICIIDFITLLFYGIVIAIPLIVLYIITLFILTDGMKFFFARKPEIYNKLTTIIIRK